MSACGDAAKNAVVRVSTPILKCRQQATLPKANSSAVGEVLIAAAAAQLSKDPYWLGTEN